jgi:hypothetical protein
MPTQDNIKMTKSQPVLPPGYQLDAKGGQDNLVAWEHVEEQLRTKRNFWVSSARPDGRPHAMPVWGVWMNGAFYFSTDPQSRKSRNLNANPHAVVHLESGDDVVILEGRVNVITDPALLQQADRVYFEKYQFHLAGDQAVPGVIFRLQPATVFAWMESTFQSSATRWKFEK